MDQLLSASVITFIFILAAVVMVAGTIGLIIYVWIKALEKMERNRDKSQILHNADIEILKEAQNVRIVNAKRNLNYLQLTDGHVIEAEPVLEETKTHIWK